MNPYDIRHFLHGKGRMGCLDIVEGQLVQLQIVIYTCEQLRACDHYIWSAVIGGKRGAGPSLPHTTARGTDGVSKCKMDVKSVHFGYMCGIKWIMFHGFWIVFKNSLLEACLTQNHEIKALLNLSIIGFLYFIMCEGLAWIWNYWNSFWLRDMIHMIPHYTSGLVTTLHDFGSA